MQLFEAYTTLQGKLQQYEESGRLMPHPSARRERFRAFAEADLMPLSRRLATILTQAGIPCQGSPKFPQLWSSKIPHPVRLLLRLLRLAPIPL